MWAHPPVVLPVGAPAAAANNGGPNRNYGLKSGSLLLQHKRHGRQWLALDPSCWVDEAQGEEEAEAEAEAELEAEAEEKRRLDYASWLPKVRVRAIGLGLGLEFRVRVRVRVRAGVGVRGSG